MKLNEVSPSPGAVKKNKRIGRGPGSGHGKTAGKGHKGQKARSGGSIPPWFEGGQMPLQRRLPKRGFHRIFKVPFQPVNIGSLDCFEKGAKVNRGTLIEAGLIKKSSLPVKILGFGELKIALDVEVDGVSRTAAKAIRDAGGSISLVSGKKVPALDKEEHK